MVTLSWYRLASNFHCLCPLAEVVEQAMTNMMTSTEKPSRVIITDSKNSTLWHLLYTHYTGLVSDSPSGQSDKRKSDVEWSGVPCPLTVLDWSYMDFGLTLQPQWSDTKGAPRFIQSHQPWGQATLESHVWGSSNGKLMELWIIKRNIKYYDGCLVSQLGGIYSLVLDRSAIWASFNLI